MLQGLLAMACAACVGERPLVRSTPDASDATSDARDAAPDIAVDALPDVPLAATCAIEPTPLANGHVTIDGPRILDGVGRTVILRGANAGGRSKFAPYMPFEFTDEATFAARAEQLATQLESWGMNVVRLPFTWGAMEPTQGTWDETYLARYAALVDAMWRHHQRVIVDFHQDVYAEVLCGDGFPAWTLGSAIAHGPPHHDCRDWFQGYFHAGSDVQIAFDRLWANADGIADAMERMWREMARRFAAHPGVIGFEVLNEPGWGTMDSAMFSATTLPRFTERMAAAIRENAPRAVIFQGGPGSDALGGMTSFTRPNLESFVYAPHFYDPLVILGANYSAAAASRARLNVTLETAAAWNTPALVGEFGGSYESPGIAPMLRDTYDSFDRHLAHGTVWEVSLATERWNDERLDLLDEAGAERPFVSEVVRGFARAVDGTIDAMQWDARSHSFVLRVSNGGTHTSEVFLPVRHVGSAPRITIDHGCIAWDAATGVLRVQPSAPAWTLVVTPAS